MKLDITATANLIKACKLAQKYIRNEKYQPDFYDDEGWKLHEKLDDALVKAIVEGEKLFAFLREETNE